MDGDSFQKEMARRIARFLKAQLKLKGITYAQLAVELNKFGLEETEASISSKFARGTFSATFLMMVIGALERDGITFKEIGYEKIVDDFYIPSKH